LKGTRDENKSGDARGVSLERSSLERSGAGRPDKPADQHYGNAAGEESPVSFTMRPPCSEIAGSTI
jgi:hypothetical protein